MNCLCDNTWQRCDCHCHSVKCSSSFGVFDQIDAPIKRHVFDVSNSVIKLKIEISRLQVSEAENSEFDQITRYGRLSKVDAKKLFILLGYSEQNLLNLKTNSQSCENISPDPKSALPDESLPGNYINESYLQSELIANISDGNVDTCSIEGNIGTKDSGRVNIYIKEEVDDWSSDSTLSWNGPEEGPPSTVDFFSGNKDIEKSLILSTERILTSLNKDETICKKRMETESYFSRSQNIANNPSLTIQDISESSYVKSADVANMSADIVKQGNKLHKCPHCECQYNLKGSLQVHMQKQHKKQFPCPHCAKVFMRRIQLKEHMRLHKDVGHYLCDICSVRINTQGELKEHYRRIHDTRMCRCQFCDFECDREYGLNRHTMTMHSDVESAMHINHANIPKKLYDYVKNRNSVGSLSLTKLVTKDGKFACESCEKTFNTPFMVKQHTLSHSNVKVYKCQICPVITKTAAKLRQHLISHRTKDFHCNLCDFQTRRSGGLIVHMKRMHNKDISKTVDRYNNNNKKRHKPDNISELEVESIKTEAKDQTNEDSDKTDIEDNYHEQTPLDDIEDTYHEQTPLDDIVADDAVKDDIVPTHVQDQGGAIQTENLSHQEVIKRHNTPSDNTARHSGKPSETITSTFKYAHNNIGNNSEVFENTIVTKLPEMEKLLMNLHHRDNNTDTPTPTLSTPNPTLNTKKRKWGYRNRKRNKPPHRPFKCTICEYRSTNNTDLIRHTYTHTGEKPFACKVCDFRCNSHSSLRYHNMNHEGINPHKCPQCTYVCKFPGSLKVHMMVHTGERPFTCDTCGKGCKTRGELNCHLLSHSQAKFMCQICGHCSKRRQGLNEHMNVHRSLKVLKCPHCDHRCNYPYHLRDHMRRRHKDKVDMVSSEVV